LHNFVAPPKLAAPDCRHLKNSDDSQGFLKMQRSGIFLVTFVFTFEFFLGVIF